MNSTALADDLQQFNFGASFGYTATPVTDTTLGAAEYTLVTIAVDVSGSVANYRQALEDCLKTVIKSCRKSPRVDNLMIRIVTFNSSWNEVHGFKLFSNINVDDYTGTIRCGGGTAVYDAIENGINSMVDYGKNLVAGDYKANGILVVLTDGEDGNSAATPTSIAKSFGKVVQSENLESLLSICICVNSGSASYIKAGKTIGEALREVCITAGFTQFEEIDAVTEDSFAKIADFMSKSISAQSQKIGTGGASKPLTF